MKYYTFFDSVTVASKPYYINREFLIRKWTPLTEEDILETGKYFIRTVLGMRYEIWNIGLRKQDEKEMEVENENSNKLYF